MSLLKNNIITDPEGWARSLVGTHWRYRFSQGMIVLFGTLLILVEFISLQATYWAFWFLPVAFSAIFAVEIPLFCLRSMRHLVIALDTEKRANGAEPAASP